MGLLLIPSPAYAYLGPGMGVGGLAVVLGILSSIFVALFVVLWYPFKRLVKRRKAQKEGGRPTDAVDRVGPADE